MYTHACIEAETTISQRRLRTDTWESTGVNHVIADGAREVTLSLRILKTDKRPWHHWKGRNK